MQVASHHFEIRSGIVGRLVFNSRSRKNGYAMHFAKAWSGRPKDDKLVWSCKAELVGCLRLVPLNLHPLLATCQSFTPFGCQNPPEDYHLVTRYLRHAAWFLMAEKLMP